MSADHKTPQPVPHNLVSDGGKGGDEHTDARIGDPIAVRSSLRHKWLMTRPNFRDNSRNRPGVCQGCAADIGDSSEKGHSPERSH